MTSIIPAILRYPFSKAARRSVKAHRREREQASLKLIMTLVVKDEEDIVEKNIRFHCAMGCDGFIVTSHNCTDGTDTILKRLKEEGLVLEIIKETSPGHQHHVWVTRMVRLARNKYGAKWVINADADEFYYSNSLNLKKSIIRSAGKFANVIWVDSLFLFPDGRPDFLSCPFFVTRPFQRFEAESLGIIGTPLYEEYIGSQGCTKVIHKTSGNPRPTDGNHSITINRQVRVETTDIRLYHFHIQNFAKYVAKVERWAASARYMAENEGCHVKRMIALHNEGKLREDYDAKYGEAMRTFLMEQGVVTRDPSVYNFLKYNGIM